jgi:hypothetical protein
MTDVVVEGYSKHLLALVAFVCLGVAAGQVSAGGEQPRRHLTVYYAHVSEDRFNEIIRSLNPERTRDSRLLALALAQELGRSWEHLVWEAEGQLVRHFGIQQHYEINALAIARWTRFPWDRWLNTSFAFGEGLSYATSTPELEPRRGSDRDTARLLNYLLAEWEFAPPRSDRVAMVLRVHHRSGVFGLFDGVHGGSNFVGVGVRYRF